MMKVPNCGFSIGFLGKKHSFRKTHKESYLKANHFLFMKANHAMVKPNQESIKFNKIHTN